MEIHINKNSTKEELDKALSKKGNRFSWTVPGQHADLLTLEVVVADITNFRGSRFIYADIQNEHDVPICAVINAYDNVNVVVRHMPTLIDKMGLTSKERKCIYYHEIAHQMSPNQKHGTKRLLEDEIDADTFAINELGADPNAMHSALIKTYRIALSQESKMKHSEEAIEAAKREIKARIKNVEEIIIKKRRKLDTQDLSRWSLFYVWVRQVNHLNNFNRDVSFERQAD